MLDPNISRYIWTHTKRQQLWVLMVVGLSMIPYFLSLNLPKQIVNGPIQGTGFEQPGNTQLFMPISLDIPFWGSVEIFSGLSLERQSLRRSTRRRRLRRRAASSTWR